MAVVAVPQPLQDVLGPEASDALVEFIDAWQKGSREDTLTFLEERFERRLAEEHRELSVQSAQETNRLDNRIAEEVARLDNRIAEEVARLDNRITEEVARLGNRITEEVARLDNRITEEFGKLDGRITEEVAKLQTQIADLRADILRWMFVFWVGQAAFVLSIILALTRK